MSPALLVGTEKDTSMYGSIMTGFAIFKSGVLSFWPCLFSVMVSASESFCNTSRGFDGGVSSEIIASERDQIDGEDAYLHGE